MTLSSAMVFTNHTMAELSAVTSIAEFRSMIVTQTLITPNIVLLQTEICLKKMSNAQVL